MLILKFNIGSVILCETFIVILLHLESCIEIREINSTNLMESAILDEFLSRALKLISIIILRNNFHSLFRNIFCIIIVILLVFYWSHVQRSFPYIIICLFTGSLSSILLKGTALLIDTLWSWYFHVFFSTPLTSELPRCSGKLRFNFYLS